MALPSSGAISFSDLKTEYWATGTALSMSQLYRSQYGDGTSRIVRSGLNGANVNVPKSGVLSLSDFHSGIGLRIINNPNADGVFYADYFSSSSDIDGDYAIIGAYGEKVFEGKAYIFQFVSSEWTLIRTISNPSPSIDNFGKKVAITGNYAIVCSGTTSSGIAYIFNVSTGALLYTINNPAGGSNDAFGESCDADGNYVIIGAYGVSDSYSTSGKAYVFNVTNGSLVRTLSNPNAYGTSLGDRFGYSVGIKGNNAIVGAYSEDASGSSDSGKAYIFNWSTGSLSQTLNNPNASSYDYFGIDVDISTSYAIVGTRGLISGVGKAYIFNASTGSLVHTLNNPNAYGSTSYDYFGEYVAITDNYAVVSAYSEDPPSGSNNGQAYVFNTTTGSLSVTLDFPNPEVYGYDEYFGYSVAISGTKALIGSRGYNTGADTDEFDGQAFVFNIG